MNYSYIAKLVEEVKVNNNEEAFTELYEITYQKFHYMAYDILKNEQEVQDSLQEIYLKIYQNIHQLSNNNTFLAWANQIAYHYCIKKKNLYKEELSYNMDLLELESEKCNPLAFVTEQEEVGGLCNLIDQLSPIVRTTMLLRYVNGFKIKEIAMIMDCPESTVKTRLGKGKKLLQKMMKDRGNRLLSCFSFFTIRYVFSLSSKTVFMPSEIAGETLSSILTMNGMASSNVAFIPQVLVPSLYSIPAFISGTVITGSVVTTIATSVAVTAVVLNPEIVSLTVPSKVINQSVKVEAELKTTEGIEDVYAKSNLGYYYQGEIVDEKHVSIEIPENGQYELFVVGDRGLRADESFLIDSIDKKGPLIESIYYDRMHFSVTFKDEKSRILLDQTYGELEDGTIIQPIMVNESNDTVIFKGEIEQMVIYASDEFSNWSRNQVTVKE